MCCCAQHTERTAGRANASTQLTHHCDEQRWKAHNEEEYPKKHSEIVACSSNPYGMAIVYPLRSETANVVCFTFSFDSIWVPRRVEWLLVRWVATQWDRQSQTIIASLLLAWFTAFSHFTCSYRIKIYGRVLMYIQIFKRSVWCSIFGGREAHTHTRSFVRSLAHSVQLNI